MAVERRSRAILPLAKPLSGKFLQLANGGSGTASILANNLAQYSALYIPAQCTIDRIGLNVTVVGAGTGGAGTAVIRLGIFTDSGGSLPLTPLAQATIDATSATNQMATINQAVTPGIYWLCGCAQGCDTTAPTVSKANGTNPFVPALSQPTTPIAGMSESPISGAFVAAAPTTGILTVADVYLRVG